MYTDNDFLCDLNEASFGLAIEEFEFNHSQKNTYIAESTSIVMEGTLGNIWEKLKKFLKSIWELLKKAWNKFIDWLQGKEKEQEEKEKKEENNKDEDQSSTTVIDNPSGDEEKDEKLYNRFVPKERNKLIEYKKSSKPKNMYLNTDLVPENEPIMDLRIVKVALMNYTVHLLNIKRMFSDIKRLIDTYARGYEKDFETSKSAAEVLQLIFNPRSLSLNNNDNTETTPYGILKRITYHREDIELDKKAFAFIAACAHSYDGAFIALDEKTHKVAIEDIIQNKVSASEICRHVLGSLADEREQRRELIKSTRKCKTKIIDSFTKTLDDIDSDFKSYQNKEYEKIPYISSYAEKISSIIAYIMKSSNNVIRALSMIISNSIKHEKYFESDENFYINKN